MIDAGHRPVCVTRTGVTLPAALAELELEVRTVSELTTFPRTLNPRRLRDFFVRHLAAAREIQQIAEDEETALVYSVSEAIFCGSLAARRLQIPGIVHVIGLSIGSPWWAARIYIPLLDRLTSQFVACSSAVAEMLANHGVDDNKIAVAHNVIPVEQIDETESLPSPIDYAGPRIGMVAAYDPRKGHELFVEAAALIARRRPDARFYLIGGVLERQAESAAFATRIESMIAELGIDDRVQRV
jgi:glycosyltransferase involved in cell wall biosynthesis